MPLNYGKSKEAFSDNVAAERNAGKPTKQAVAIAYSVQRKGKPKKKDADEHPMKAEFHKQMGEARKKS